MAAATVDRAMREILTEHNLPTGTALENMVTWRLHRWGILDKTQYSVGPYRIDFAWPAKKIAVEADGPHHWMPDVAVKDVARDAYLRSQGWLVFRVDDVSDTLEDQLARVAAVVSAAQDVPVGEPSRGYLYPVAVRRAVVDQRLAELGGGDHAA